MTGAAAFRSTLLAGLGGAWSRRCVAALAALTLASCAGTPAQPTAAQSDERRLFVETNESILKYHIKPTLPQELALTGLARLSAIDSKISIEHTADAVILHVGDQSRRFDAPAPSAVVDWSVLTSKVLDAARRMSPLVAATPADKLETLVIDGTLAKLDRYSRYVAPDVARRHRAERDGFAGIGVTLDIRPDDVRIAGVMPHTPAAKAGLVVGDRIVSLDGVPVDGLSPQDIRKHLRGPAQTKVQLAVARNGLPRPLTVSIERARIVPDTVSLEEKDGIAWLKISLFNDETAERLAALLYRAHRDMGPHLDGIVLDLRDDPGGLLDQAVDVVSLFIKHGPVLSTYGRNPAAMQYFTAGGVRTVETAPMVVLVNGGSASASEIVASALQDSGRAVVVGTSSYGKGTVQTVIRTSNGGELTVTWAHIITAGGYQLNRHGVVPTVCTSNAADTRANIARLIPASASPVPSDLAVARASLDSARWRHLRALCPPKFKIGKLDDRVAERLLDRPLVYREALASLRNASTRLVESER